MSDQNGQYARGLEIRREVLGAEHVTRSLEAATEFARPMQDLVTDYCWGAIWGRPGLDRQTRSIINLAMLAAMNRQHELGVHVRGALRNGCTTDQIAEVLLQVAIYCGVPAGLEATRTAEAAMAAYATEIGTTTAAAGQ